MPWRPLRRELDKPIQALSKKNKATHANGQPLWPAPFSLDTPESCASFLVECCWTFNEANSSVERIPKLPYIREFAEIWHECRAEGRPLILEKSRRLLMSWVLRGLELWRIGLDREKGLIAGLNYAKAAEHVWRVWWLYEQLRQRRPEFALPQCIPRGGSIGAQSLRQVLLPNGSLVEALNQDGQSFQGAGYSWVTMEEFSLYRNPHYMWGQAIRVTEGKPGSRPGMVCVVTNASSSKAWQEIKKLGSSGSRGHG